MAAGAAVEAHTTGGPPALVPATPPAVPTSPTSDDVEELFRTKAFALLSEPAVLDAIRRDLTGKSSVARTKVLLGLVAALKREAKASGAGSGNTFVFALPRPH